MIRNKHRTWANVKPRNPVIRIKMEELIYEHKILKISTLDNVEKTLNEMSAEGWSFVCAVEDIHYFKRPKNQKKIL